MLRDFLGLAWPLVGWWLLTLAPRAAAATAWRDGSLLLLAGALLVLPLTTKSGASWNYLVPAVAALAVATARGWAARRQTSGSPARHRGRGALGARSRLALALGRPFPLPTRGGRAYRARLLRLRHGAHARERRTAADAAARARLRTRSASRSRWRAAASSTSPAARRPAPSSCVERLRRRATALVVGTWPLPDTGSYREAAARSYVQAGGCTLGYYFGTVTATLLPRRDLFRPMSAQAGTRCGAFRAETPTTH